MKAHLPQTWTAGRIGTLLELKYGKGLPQEKRHSGGTVKVYGSNGAVGMHDRAITRGPTIILGRKGSVGEVNFSQDPVWPIDTTYYIDEFPADFPPNYWTLCLKSLSLGQQEKSSAIPGVSRDDIYEVEVPIPPLNEQRRIAAKLEQLFVKVDACQKRLEKIPVILKRFRQSVLAAACSGRLTADWRQENRKASDPKVFLETLKAQRLSLCKTALSRIEIEKQFRGLVLGEIIREDGWVSLAASLFCDFITKGTTPHSNEISSSGAIPFLKVYNIIDNKIDFNYRPQFVSEKVHRGVLARSMVYPGDVVMNIVGPPLGKVAVITAQFPEWNINQALAIFRPVKAVSPAFLHISLLGGDAVNEIIAETRGIVGQSNISLEQCRSLRIPLAPPPEQHEIVRRVEALFALADQIETRYRKAKAHVDKLTQSILAKAFRGELVPQDPNDEPASKLLERIRSETTEKRPQNRNKKRV